MGRVATRRWWIALTVLALLLLGATRFWPTVQRIEIIGAQHHEPRTIANLARVTHDDPLLWITRWRVGDLMRDPWIRQARVTRHWPDTITIAVWERVPYARAGTRIDDTVWAEDGTVLPGATIAERVPLPVVKGWGEDRTVEALKMLRLLQDRQPKVIQYSPLGFEIVLSDIVIQTPDQAALERQWAAVERSREGRLAIYPWGVSVADE